MRVIYTICCCMLLVQLHAQFKPIPPQRSTGGNKPQTAHHAIKPLSRFSVAEQNLHLQATVDYANLPKLNLAQRKAIPGPVIIWDEKSALPIYIEGEASGLPELRDAPSGKRA
ncbi:MAG TPA: hypothetical protein PLE32_11335, partial [Haliscomenobacter sp.]|nr:hypothetical protein [Haliscomenobacter sp.]